MNTQGRRWLEMSVRCPSAGNRAALLADGLVSLGGRAVEERGGWYVSYFAEPEDVDAFVREARDLLSEETGLSSIQIEHGWQLHEDWAETWKRGLVPRRVSERIIVHPSWSLPTDVRPEDVVIVLDPGMAFGTAEHGRPGGVCGCWTAPCGMESAFWMSALGRAFSVLRPLAWGRTRSSRSRRIPSLARP